MVLNEITMDRRKVGFISDMIEVMFEIYCKEVFAVLEKIPLKNMHLRDEEDNIIVIKYQIPMDKYGITQTAYINEEPKESKFKINIDYKWEIEKWRNVFSIEEFLSEITKIVNRDKLTMNAVIEGYELRFICNTNSINCLEKYCLFRRL